MQPFRSTALLISRQRRPQHSEDPRRLESKHLLLGGSRSGFCLRYVRWLRQLNRHADDLAERDAIHGGGPVSGKQGAGPPQMAQPRAG